MSTLRQLLGDIADRGRTGELAEAAWLRARRLRARRRMMTAASGLVGVLVLLIGSLTVSSLVLAPPVVRAPVTSELSGLRPGELPGGWVWGGGPGQDGRALVFDRVSRDLREVPYDRAIPAPAGDLAYVAQPDNWAGILNLRTGAVQQLQAAGAGEWAVGPPQWSADGRRLLRADGEHLYVTDAATGQSHRVNLDGGCDNCTSAVWLPGEAEVAIPLPARTSGGLQIYALETGAKLRTVSWYGASSHGFSPDRRHVVAKVDGRVAVVDVATGAAVAEIAADDPHTVYWAGTERILAIEHGGAAVHTLAGKRIGFYPRPQRFGDDDPPSFTLIRGS